MTTPTVSSKPISANQIDHHFGTDEIPTIPPVGIADPMWMLADIRNRMDGIEKALEVLLNRSLTVMEAMTPGDAPDPLANERTARGEELARAIREVSR